MSARRISISTSISGSSALAYRLQRRRQIASTHLQRVLRQKAIRKRVIRFSLVGANIVVLVVVMLFVATSSHAEVPSSIVNSQSPATAATSPVDDLTSYYVAASVAEAANLPEKTPIINQAQSAQVAAVVTASDTSVAVKPQIVSTSQKSWRDITSYTVQAGDNVESLAQKFGVTSASIRWSNGLSGDGLSSGTQLYIPPMNGVVYTVKSGDTPQSLATSYHADASQITEANDAENGLDVGRRIIIPNGQIIAATTTRTSSSYSVLGGSFVPEHTNDGYPWGWCTWYAAMRSGAPSNWGNANTWAYYARLSGWTVSSTPVAGAIFQTPAGWAGHVGIVEEVYSNGTMEVSDMNGIAGFGRVGYAVIPISTYPNFIYR